MDKISSKDYDAMQRKLRDRGLLETNDIIRSGITKGRVLEIGPGPGYLGLEWLKRNPKASLYWLEISEDMKKLAMINAESYNLKDKIVIKIGDATRSFPFESNYFDAVFACGSLHEWTIPINVINEIGRVLKRAVSILLGILNAILTPLLYG